MGRIPLFCSLALLLLGGCNRDAGEPQFDPTKEMHLASSAFADGAAIPKHFAGGDGDDKSPPLKWSDAPAGVKSYALICDDPDAPMGTFVHWVIWNMPGDAHELAEGAPTDAKLSDGSRQGKNDFDKVGYGGPNPPAGKAHRYYFKIYALDTVLNLPEASTTKSQLVQAMNGHVLARGQVIGTYQK
jgi:Raf kinase inhibitor-like YbhB/YbcL family protein